MSGRNALGREVREYIAIGANGGPVSVQAYAPPLASLGNLPMAGLISTEGNTKAAATVVSFLQPHGLVTGDTVFFSSSDSLPVIDGARVVTVIDSVSFSVPVNTLVGASSDLKTVSLAAAASIDTVANHGIVNLDTVVIAGSDSVPTVNGSRVATKIDADTFTVPVNTNATQQFAISSITKASPAIVTTTTPHLLKAGATNMLIAATDSVPVIDNAARACTYIDATHFSVAVDVATGSDFNITSASAASPSVFVTAAHGMLAGDTTVTVSGCDRVPDINGVKVATKTGATGFTIPSAATGTFTITGISQANPTVVTVAGGHSLKAGTTSVAIAGTNSTPALDGASVTATYVDATTFTVAVDVTVAGTAGTVTYGRAGSATGKINYGRAGTTGTADYKRAGTQVGTVTYGNAGTTAAQMQPAIIGISLGTAPIITTGQAHGLRTGDTVTTAATDSTPAVDDTYAVTVIDDRTFTIPAASEVTVVGTAGKLVKVTYNSSVLDRGGATGGGALVVTTSLGHATGNTIKLNIQGSADGVNWWSIPYALVATPRTFVTTEITRTTGAAVTYLLQELVYWRYLRVACNTSRNLGVSVAATYVAYP